MKHIFEQAIANVQSAYPSVYTKEDVVKLINDIQAGVEAADLDRPDFNDRAIEVIKESLLEGVRNISFEDCVGLELNYDNRIDIEIDERAILDLILESFDIAVDEARRETGKAQTKTNQ